MVRVAAITVGLQVILCLHSLVVFAQPSGSRCPPIQGGPSCACQPPGEAILDLSGLSGTNGTARFTGVGPDPTGYVYSFNPCKTFFDKCQDVFICQYADNGLFFAIADNGTEQIWISNNGTKYLHYIGDDAPRGEREAYVYLECDHTAVEPTITTVGDSRELLKYEFFLKSCHACPGGCKVPPPTPPGPTLCPPILGEPSCKCQHPDGVIDLTSLARLNGTARFTGILAENNFNYSYNPCQGYREDNCWNVHVCRKQVGSNSTTPIAEVGTEAIYYETNGLAHVHYRGPGQLQTKVYLECDQAVQDPIITTVEDAHCPLIYEFTVRSCQVCPGGCKGQKKT